MRRLNTLLAIYTCIFIYLYIFIGNRYVYLTFILIYFLLSHNEFNFLFCIFLAAPEDRQREPGNLVLEHFVQIKTIPWSNNQYTSLYWCGLDFHLGQKIYFVFSSSTKRGVKIHCSTHSRMREINEERTLRFVYFTLHLVLLIKLICKKYIICKPVVA